MVHCGYEPSAVADTFGSLRGLATVARLFLFGPSRDNEIIDEPQPPRRPKLRVAQTPGCSDGCSTAKPHFDEARERPLVELTVLK